MVSNIIQIRIFFYFAFDFRRGVIWGLETISTSFHPFIICLNGKQSCLYSLLVKWASGVGWRLNETAMENGRKAIGRIAC